MPTPGMDDIRWWTEPLGEESKGADATHSVPAGLAEGASALAQSALRRFAQLAETMPDGIVMADVEGRILYANELILQLSGYRREELVGGQVEVLVPARLRAAHVNHRTGYVADPRTRPMGSGLSIVLLRKDGTEVPADIALSAVPIPGGLLVVAAVRDVTERRRAEERVRESHALLKAVIEGTTDAIFVKDLDGRYLLVNSACARGLGKSIEEVIGSNDRQLFPLKDVNIFSAEDRQIIASGEVATFEETVTVGGSIRSFITMKAPLRDDEGRVIGLLGVARDFTDRKRAEDRVQAVREVTDAILQGRDSGDVLRMIAGRARGLVGAAVAMVITSEGNGEPLVVRAADGIAADALEHMRLPGTSLAAEVLRTGRPLRIDDLSDDSRSYAPVVHAGELGPALYVPLAARGRVLGVLLTANRKGGRVFGDEALEVVELFAGQAAMAVEHARVKEGLHRLAITSMTAARPLLQTLDDLARSIVEETDAVAGALFLVDAELTLRTAGTYGLPQGFAEAMDAADRAGARRPALKAIESRAPVIIEDGLNQFLSDPLFAPAHDLLRGVPWDTIVSLPLLYGGRVLGALCGYYPKGYRPGPAEVALLKVIADQAASTVENASLLAAGHDKVAQDERQRLARELHDSVSQALFGIALGARTALELVGRDPAGVLEPLNYVLQLAEAGLAEMRALIFELRPESLREEGLTVALTKQLAAVQARHGITAEASLGTEPVVALDVKSALYRIAQEALHNAVKHARAKRLVVRLESSGSVVFLEIADDGVGFNPQDDFPGHLGLRSMTERAMQLGGTLQVQSAPDQGTRIRVQIPLGPATKPDPGHIG